MMDNEVVTKALTMLEALLEKKPTSHQELTTQAETILTVIRVPRDSDYLKVLDEVIRRYESNVGVKAFDPDVLVNDPASDIWFTTRRDDIEHPYFDRYCRYLRQNGWDNDVISNLKLNCERTLSRCADPQVSADLPEAKKRGMVMGDVQAGKTANYLGLINMACDYGYRVIVLLAGLTDSLRKQTQDRVDFGFIGAHSNSIGGVVKFVGVGTSAQQYYAIPLTNGDYDFAKFIQKSVNAAPTDFNKPVILVIKKNAKILESVHNWLKPGEHNISGDSILIIDDEADNASINTKKPEYDPSIVNLRIRDIYNNFPIASYIGFTATPFANIFINPHDACDSFQDLFPADFIVQLNPPDTYFGGEKVFPSDGSISLAIRLLNTEEPNFVPVKHKKDLHINILPDSLKEAILCFLINNVIRTLSGDKYKHRSMMINISPLNDPQESIRNAVDAYITVLKNIIEQDSYKAERDFIKNAEALNLYKLFAEPDAQGSDFYAEVRRDYTWIDIQHGLWEEIKQFETTIINNRYRGDMRYDYSAHDELGARVIVIGGFVLSRGLTLEGLCTSYYSRSATAYDTLLQMSRWFGYRPRYENLCRIYLSQANVDSFGAVMDAIRDLKDQFREMELQGKTPKEFGLMVKESPATLNTTLLITARNKMYHTQVFEHYINYGGVYADTSKLFKDVAKNRANLERVSTFIEEQRAKGLTFSKVGNRFMLCGVTSTDISDFIRRINVPSVNKRFDCTSLSAYIEQSSVFPIWDVVAATGDSSQVFSIQGHPPLQSSIRTFRLGSADENYIRLGGTNNRIIDPGIFDSGVIITPEQKQEILIKKQRRRPDKPSDQLTATDWLRLRERPLLVLYYIDLKIDTSRDLAERDKYIMIKEAFGSDLLIGFAVGFPARDSKVLIHYRANMVKSEAINTDEEDFDEEELSDE